jgi:transposase
MAKPRAWKELAYCSQITVDLASKIVLANDVCQDSCDYAQLPPQLEKTEELLGKLRKGTKVSADNGYYKGLNLYYLEEKGLDGYLPDEKWAATANGREIIKSPYFKRKFYYAEEGDCFVCPEGRVLTRVGVHQYKDKRIVWEYGCHNCEGCPVRSKCAKTQSRRITSQGFEGERKRMAKKMESEEGKAVYDLRDGIEPVFGDIKQNMKHREFVMRGLKGVRAEFSLVCTAHNLKRMWNLMGQRIELVERSAAGTAAGAALLSRHLLFLWSKSGC